ncbi:hypothetical protein, partial [Paraburkholderia caribensis]|uniref:hypothetical protein n=1 Tax=Paraburkholderia caribensis TaxID=75105 RepID=UPI001ABBB14D
GAAATARVNDTDRGDCCGPRFAVPPEVGELRELAGNSRITGVNRRAGTSVLLKITRGPVAV